MALNLPGGEMSSPYLPFADSSITSELYKGKVKTAVIIAAGNGSRLQGYQNGRPKPLLKVGGITLLERVILSIKKAGIEEVVIVVGYQAARIRMTIRAKKLGVKITWVRNTEWRQPNGVSVLKVERYVSGKFLLFMSDHIFDYKILDRVKEVDLGNDGGLLCVDYNLNRIPNLDDATKVRTKNDRLIDLNKSLTDFNAIDTGIFLLTPHLFEALRISQERGDFSLSGGIRVLAEQGGMKTFDVGDTFWQDVDTVPDAKYAERLLLRATRSKGDGIIARTINRRVSNRISKVLLKTPITPNQISTLNLGLSLFTAWLVSLGTPITTIIGGLLFQMASILDGCDGEVAIIKLRDSRFGARIDTVTDQLSYIAFVIGLTVGAYNATGNPYTFAVTSILIVLLLFTLNVMRNFAARQDSASMKTVAAAVGSLNHSGQKVWYLRLCGILNHLGRRDGFSFGAMLVMFAGNITVIYVCVMLTLIIMVVGIPVSVAAVAAADSGLSLRDFVRKPSK